MQAALVDPGGESSRLLERVSAHGVQLTQILLTHAHIDHAGAAGQLSEDKGLPIIGPHEGDQFWIDGLADQSRMFQFPEAKPFTTKKKSDQLTHTNQICCLYRP